MPLDSNSVQPLHSHISLKFYTAEHCTVACESFLF